MAAPSKLLFCVNNAMDTPCVLSSSPAFVSTLPLTHAQLPSRGRIARSTSAVQQVINFHWNGSAYYFNFFLVNRHNLEPAATYRLQLFSDMAKTTVVYDSRVANGGVNDYYAIQAAMLGELQWGVDPLGAGIFDAFLGHKYSLLYFDRVLAVAGTLTINDTGNSSGYVEFSRLFGGEYIELLYNPDSAKFSWQEDTTQSRSDGGSLRSDGKITYRTASLAVNWLDPSQRVKVADMSRYAGKRMDFFASTFPNNPIATKERDFTGLWKFKNMPNIDESGSSPMLHTTFDMEEA